VEDVGKFLATVAEATPAPGGGTSAGVTAALAAALVEMSAGIAGETEAASRARELRTRALELAEAELSSYAPVLKAPDPEARERALAKASEPPAAIAEVAADAAELGVSVASSASPAVKGDALTGVVLAEAAASAAARLVEINLGGAGSSAPLERARQAERRAVKARASVAR
jgi:formiminotetrahydrofolate cyclodeaminase